MRRGATRGTLDASCARSHGRAGRSRRSHRVRGARTAAALPPRILRRPWRRASRSFAPSLSKTNRNLRQCVLGHRPALLVARVDTPTTVRATLFAPTAAGVLKVPCVRWTRIRDELARGAECNVRAPVLRASCIDCHCWSHASDGRSAARAKVATGVLGTEPIESRGVAGVARGSRSASGRRIEHDIARRITIAPVMICGARDHHRRGRALAACHHEKGQD